MADKKKPVSIEVPRKEEEKKESLEERKQKEAEKQLDLAKKPRDDEKEDKSELSEEDKKLKESLALLVQRVMEEKDKLQHAALEQLRTTIRSATTSMTSIPKPLKFLRPFYDSLKKHYDTMTKGDNKEFLADILSVLAMTMAKEGTRESLKFKLQGSKEEIGAWGHQYVRNISGEISQEWKQRVAAKQKVDDLDALVKEVLPFNMKHNAEYEAVDLLLEIEELDRIKPLVTSDHYARVNRYLLGCQENLAEDPEERNKLLRIVYDIFLKHNQYADALRIAVKLDSTELVSECFERAGEEKDPCVSKQLGFILGSMRMSCSSVTDSDLQTIIGNVNMNTYFLKLASDLDVKEAKTPEDIYKSHLVEGHSLKRTRDGSDASSATVDSAKANLASSFVNAFINCGFGKDKLITPEDSEWIYKNKDVGMMSATASLGMILLWDQETGFTKVDKYMFSQQQLVRAGAILATGLLGSGVTSEMDAALAILSEHVNSSESSTTSSTSSTTSSTVNKDPIVKLAAILGLGFAYAGTQKQDVLEILTPMVLGQPIEVISNACLALGLVFCGTANDDVSSNILQAFMDMSETELKDPVTRLACLGMGLLFLGKGEAADACIEASKAIQHVGKYLAMVVETCAYAGTGSLLECQKLLSVLSDHIEDDEKDPLKSIHQEVATLGLALVAMGDEINTEMMLRSLDHVLQYGELNIRRNVPLALGLISISNPRLTVMDTLSKLTHDSDDRVSMNAILALGFLGAGTNNARIAGILRQLVSYYAKEANHLFLVRISQGLLHLGKGLMTLNPYQSDNLLLNKVALAGLLVVLHAGMDMKNTLVGKRHYLLYSLVCSARPRCLITVDEDLKSIPVSVRVGQSVDVSGQPGNPKAISGFQTHTTPVLLASGERAELADDKYIPYSAVLEGFVICKKNPSYKAES
eukprot:TRINITY_DN1318_c0_g1_i1.p1 TRINITY_DN1318_c0_g1~~TRINITY_DN1318_c0_g1_i1.p1  ORF type:complete len:926 (+),score=227.84 TRINITY_DN1318_c0_g1_i1:113-2890(+)